MIQKLLGYPLHLSESARSPDFSSLLFCFFLFVFVVSFLFFFSFPSFFLLLTFVVFGEGGGIKHTYFSLLISNIQEPILLPFERATAIVPCFGVDWRVAYS